MKVILVFHFLLFGVFFICRLVDVDFIVVYLLILIFLFAFFYFDKSGPANQIISPELEKKLI